jgi:autotransporter-associated beta strand protein
MVDNTTGTGGILGLTKTGTGTIGLPTSQNEYSGPTLINNGILEFTANGAPSPNSDHQINTPGQLKLSYDGTRNINGLFINGVRQPAGVYSAVTHPDFITGDGTLTIAQVHPTYPAVLGVTGSASSVLLGWTGVGVLQSSPDLETWTNLPGASSPFAAVTVSGQKMYYRVKQ